MSVENVLTVGVILVLLAGVIGQGITVYRKDSQNADLIKMVNDTLVSIANNPVWIENAKAAGAGIPPIAYNALLAKLDTLDTLVGGQTELGQAVSSLENVIREIAPGGQMPQPPTPTLPPINAAAG